MDDGKTKTKESAWTAVLPRHRKPKSAANAHVRTLVSGALPMESTAVKHRRRSDRRRRGRRSSNLNGATCRRATNGGGTAAGAAGAAGCLRIVELTHALPECAKLPKPSSIDVSTQFPDPERAETDPPSGESKQLSLQETIRILQLELKDKTDQLRRLERLYDSISRRSNPHSTRSAVPSSPLLPPKNTLTIPWVPHNRGPMPSQSTDARSTMRSITDNLAFSDSRYSDRSAVFQRADSDNTPDFRWNSTPAPPEVLSTAFDHPSYVAGTPPSPVHKSTQNDALPYARQLQHKNGGGTAEHIARNHSTQQFAGAPHPLEQTTSLFSLSLPLSLNM